MKQEVKLYGFSFSLLLLLSFLSCKKEFSCEACAEENKPPVAVAGPDQTLTLPKDSVLLDGSASFDTDGSITSFKWTKVEGPSSFRIVDHAGSKTTVNNLTAGVYRFELTVTDNGSLSAKDTVQVMVDNPAVNQPPVTCAGTDQVITLPADTATLDGSCSTDPENNIMGYLWSKINGPSSFFITHNNAKVTSVTGLVEGVYQFELKVTDSGALFSKDTVTVRVSSGNKPPVANAGADQTITIPANTAKLDGSASADPDGNITSYQWTKVSGPASFYIVNANAAQTEINTLVEGTYHFELKVTDAGGLSAKDTVQLTVNKAAPIVECGSNRPQVNARLVPVGKLSQARRSIASAAAGNKIVFAGGSYFPTGTLPYEPSSRVDIYDVLTNTWSTAELSVARDGITAVANGNKIFLGGGEAGDGTAPSKNVDIFDVSANTWTVSHLSTSGSGIAAATLGNKVFFAGGQSGFTGTPGIAREKTVDIYDISTGRWSRALMSESRYGGHSVVGANSKIYIAGGETHSNGSNLHALKSIDIYDNVTNTWSTSSLTEAKSGLAGVAVHNKIYWAGGLTGSRSTNSDMTLTCTVEIRDVITGNSSIQHLSRPAGGKSAILKDNKILFFLYSATTGMEKFDLYDTTTNTWSVGLLPKTIVGAAVISVNNTIYIAGGEVDGVLSNQVWKLEF